MKYWPDVFKKAPSPKTVVDVNTGLVYRGTCSTLCVTLIGDSACMCAFTCMCVGVGTRTFRMYKKMFTSTSA